MVVLELIVLEKTMVAKRIDLGASSGLDSRAILSLGPERPAIGENTIAAATDRVGKSDGGVFESHLRLATLIEGFCRGKRSQC